MNPSTLAVVAGVLLGASIVALIAVVSVKRLRTHWVDRAVGLSLLALVFLSGALLARSVNVDSYDRCTNRNVNIEIANHFYRSMASLEAHNRFIDAKLRAHRVALYNGVVYPPARCGDKP